MLVCKLLYSCVPWNLFSYVICPYSQFSGKPFKISEQENTGGSVFLILIFVRDYRVLFHYSLVVGIACGFPRGEPPTPVFIFLCQMFTSLAFWLETPLPVGSLWGWGTFFWTPSRNEKREIQQILTRERASIQSSFLLERGFKQSWISASPCGVSFIAKINPQENGKGKLCCRSVFQSKLNYTVMPFVEEHHPRSFCFYYSLFKA